MTGLGAAWVWVNSEVKEEEKYFHCFYFGLTKLLLKVMMPNYDYN